MARKRSRKNISPAKSGAQQRAAINGAVENIEDSRSRSVLVLGIFVLLFCLITVTSFLQKSPTWDEPAHLFAGYSYLKWGDFRANPEHPPLAKLLAALPLLAFDIKDPRTADAYWDLIPTGDPQNLYALLHRCADAFCRERCRDAFFLRQTANNLSLRFSWVFSFMYGANNSSVFRLRLFPCCSTASTQIFWPIARLSIPT